MTGEIFSFLSEQSVLRHSVMNDEIFIEGAHNAVNNPSQFTNELFSVRACDVLHQGLVLFGKARLSGLLIGIELAGTRELWQGRKVMLLGDSRLQLLYQLAMDHIRLTSFWSMLRK